MSLNPGQLRAVQSPGHCLIVACPGSGKTHTLVCRAERLLSISDKHVIATVTFTRTAAEEMRERLVRALGEAVRKRIIAGTFHGLALQQIERLCGEGKRPFGIASEAHTNILILKAWQHVVGKSRSRTNLTREEIKKGIEYAKANRGHVQASEHGEMIKEAIDFYQGQLRAQKMLDFGDMIEMAVQGMQSGRIDPVGVGVTHMLVDEFQDADTCQVDWVLEHAARGVRVTCVGDDDQSIYGFRHAKGYDALMLFAQRTRAETITLETTYRCCQSVVAHASRLILHNKARVAKSISTANAKPGIVERNDYKTPDDEINAVIDAMAVGTRQGTSAILARTKAVLRAIETRLVYLDLPYQGGVDGSIWSGGVPGLLRGLIAAAVGRDSNGITMALSARGMGREGITAAREALVSGGGFKALSGTASWLKGVADSQSDLWSEMRGDFVAMEATASSTPAVFVNAAIAFIKPGIKGFNSDGIFNAIAGIIGRMQGGLKEVHKRIEEEVRKKDRDDPSRGTNLAVHLLTLHASKGLEFDRVWMPCMADGILPHGQSDLEEERRLCYVGATRARQHLTLSYAPIGDSRESAFLTEMGLAMRGAGLRDR